MTRRGELVPRPTIPPVGRPHILLCAIPVRFRAGARMKTRVAILAVFCLSATAAMLTPAQVVSAEGTLTGYGFSCGAWSEDTTFPITFNSTNVWTMELECFVNPDPADTADMNDMISDLHAGLPTLHNAYPYPGEDLVRCTTSNVDVGEITYDGTTHAATSSGLPDSYFHATFSCGPARYAYGLTSTWMAALIADAFSGPYNNWAAVTYRPQPNGAALASLPCSTAVSFQSTTVPCAHAGNYEERERPEAFVGQTGFEGEPNVCEGLGVSFDPAGDVAIPAGGRQSVEVNLPSGITWDDITLRFSFQWGYENTDPDRPVYGGGYTRDYTVTNVDSDTRIYRVRTSVATDNYAFHMQCLGGPEIIYYRRISGSTSTSEGPGYRPCYWLVVRFDSPRLEPTQLVSLRVDGRVAESDGDGIENIQYVRFGTFGFPVLREADTWDPSVTFPIDDDQATTQGAFDFTGTSAEGSDAGHAIACTDLVGTMYIPRPPGGSTGPGSPEPTGGVGSDPATEDGEPVPTDGGGGGPGGGGPGTIPGGTGSGDGQGLGGGDCYGTAELSLWSPLSWVNYGVNAVRCVVLGLLVPDVGDIQASFENFRTELEAQFPFSMIFAAVDFLDQLGQSMTSASGSGCFETGGSWSFGDSGSVPVDDVCIGDGLTVGSTQRALLATLIMAPMVWVLIRHAWGMTLGGKRATA